MSTNKHEISMSPARRFWNAETNRDSLYHIYLKKITYSSNNDLNDSDSLQWETRRIRLLKAATIEHIMEYILLLTPHQRELNVSSSSSSSSSSSPSNHHHCNTTSMEEGRNDVTHIMHVIFCTYRKYCSPQELFTILVKHSRKASPHQLRFVLHYWLRYYPEDFLTPLQLESTDVTTTIPTTNTTTTISTTSVSTTTSTTSTTSTDDESIINDSLPIDDNCTSSPSVNTKSKTTSNRKSSSYLPRILTAIKSKNINNENGKKGNDETTKIDSSLLTANNQSKSPRSSSQSKSTPSTPTPILNSPETQLSNQKTLFDLLLLLPCIDDTLYRKAHLFVEQSKFDQTDQTSNSRHNSINKSPAYCIIDLDTKFVAQQLTAIDLENFLSLKPYTLLNGHRQNPRVQNMIKNFNLLSKHVVITILKAHSPDLVTTHWINIAQQLRKMKNFNSLKAVIAGLSNESIFRLKQTVWSKINKTIESTFKQLSTIVDDVDNQTLLRQTQLEIEGTAKVSIEEESFGTIPYLGIFLTDLTFIDTKSSNYIENPKAAGKKLINLEKCCKQFEIITQIHLLQQNINAALTAYHQSQQLTGLSQLPNYNSTPTVPRIVVARLFRAWFQDSIIADMTDNDCYKLSLALETSQSQKK
ncbi:ras guanine nucleotide exchange factor K-like [Panonychus citri]|uniref:ras guanine nucleotide exchange factor K-like n=1 Tax=Panonychus citri TaxID=50023 RepID=UPI002307147C|nr:ras guanine nucleotide exchange factor K-like [Panonychus citri]